MKDSSNTTPKTVLISIKPEHVEKILTGQKTLEFRRSWAKYPVDKLVIYSTSPQKRIVAIADIKNLYKGSPNFLWLLSKEKKGGISRRFLYSYFHGKKEGFAIELDNIFTLPVSVDPRLIFKKFTSPQSFCYVSDQDMNILKQEIKEV